MSAAITRHLDVTGTFCPLPILLAVRELLRLAAGDRLEIVGDDPAILEDMPVWCERAGHRLIEISEQEGKITSIIEKGGAPRADAGRRRPRGTGGSGGTGGAGGEGGAGGAGVEGGPGGERAAGGPVAGAGGRGHGGAGGGRKSVRTGGGASGQRRPPKPQS